MIASLKKKLAIKNQYLAEKFSKDKRRNVNEEYEQLSKTIDTYKRYCKDVTKCATECLEPGTNIRLRPAAAPNGTHQSPTKVTYPHAEARLSELLAQYAKAFDPDSHLGGTLSCASDGYAQLAEAKNRASEDTQARFTNPVTDMADNILKEIIDLRKKANNYRLAFEVEQNRVEKGTITIDSPQYLEAERKYQDAYQDSYDAMNNFLGCEAEHIELLSNLITAQLGYVQDAQRVLMDMQSSLQAKLKEARDNPTVHVPKNTGKNTSSSQSDISPQYHMKPAYETHIPREPECVALYDFQAEAPEELTFKEHDRIKLIEQLDENWFLGEKDGVRGNFPTSYVKVLVPLP